MNKYDRCERCPDEDTGKCDTCMEPVNVCDGCELDGTLECEKCEKRVCRACGCTWNNACPGGCYWVEKDLCSQCVGADQGMELTYTFVLRNDVCSIEGLHNDLDRIVEDLGFGLVRSTLESPDEIVEHEFEEVIEIPVINPSQDYYFEAGF